MRWLNIEYIKDHSRLDFACEDALLELYGNSAEETVLSLCGTTEEELLEAYGDIPDAIRHASLMLVDVAYQYRSPITPSNVSTVPYTFDMLIKPYMKLV